MRRSDPIPLKCTECSADFFKYKTTANLSYCRVCIKRVCARRSSRNNRARVNAYRKRTRKRKKIPMHLTCARCERVFVRVLRVARYCNACRMFVRKRKHETSRGRSTPGWADQGAIAAFYEIAKRVTRCTGIRFEVDHIIPLQGKNVCGLHVPTNLRVIPKFQNGSKGNRFEAI